MIKSIIYMVSWDEFEKMTDGEWMAKAEADLKGKKSIHDLLYNIDDDFKISPFITNVPISQPILNCSPKSGTLIKGKSIDELNKNALKMLQLGSQSLVFELDSNVDFTTLFNGIFLNMVDIYLKVNESDSPVISEKINEFLNLNYKDIAVNIFICDSIFQSTLEAPFSDRIKLYLKFCSSIDQPRSYKSYIFLPLKKDFLAQIAELRAMRKLWNVSNKKPEHLKIISYIDESVIVDTEVHPLIIVNYLLMSAYFGMSDVVLGLPLGDDEELARLTLNIQHIFKEESGLDFVLDPTAGSYLIETITNEFMKVTI